jgi:hypothetical protein
MTLALPGKSRRRQSALIAAALIAIAAGVLVALAFALRGPAEAQTSGQIQIHKYVPKDNVNTPWQNAAQPAFTFNVYDVDPVTNPGATPIASGTQLGSPISGVPQDKDIWLTEAPAAGYTPAGFWIPDTGNSQCNQQPADGSTLTAAPLEITPGDWTHADNKGIFHICAYNNIAPGNGTVVVEKLADPNGAAPDSTTFTGSLSDGSSTTWGPIGFGDSTGDLSLPPDTYTISEDTPANGWTTLGFALATGGVCPSTAAAYSATSPSIIVASGATTTVCVMNTRAANGSVIVKKVAQPGSISDATTTFSGAVGPASWSGLHIGDTSSAISLAPSTGYTLSEDTPTGGWSLVGFQVVSTGTACSTDPADYTDTTVPVVSGATNVVCVMNNDPATRTVVLVKRLDSGTGAAATFGGTISNNGGVGFTALGISTATTDKSQEFSLSTAAHDIAETTMPSGYALDGYFVVSGATAASSCFPDTLPALSATATIPAGSGNYVVCIVNKVTETPSRTVRVQKVTTTAEHPAATFPVTVTPANNSTGVTFDLSLAANAASNTPGQSVSATYDQQTVTEGALPDGWTLQGYDVIADPDGTATCSNNPSAYGTEEGDNVVAGATYHSSEPTGSDALVCILNTYTAPSAVTLVKSNDAGGTVASNNAFNWLLTATVSNSPSTSAQTISDTVPGGFTINSVAASTGITCQPVDGQDVTCSLPAGTPVGEYTVTINVTAPHAAPDVCNQTVTNTAHMGSLAPHDSIKVTCAEIVAKKYSDPTGKLSGSGGLLDGWTITVSQLDGGEVATGVTGADGPGTVVFLLDEGAYRVSETGQNGWVTVGSTVDGAVATGQAAASRRASTGSEVYFFNQAVGALTIIKTELGPDAPIGRAGIGWSFMITGCGITRTGITEAPNGTVTFTDLPLCTYTVTEDPNSKIGFKISPATPNNRTVTLDTPGQGRNIGFTNIENCTSGCIPEIQVPMTPTPGSPTTTPSPTPVEPTPSPTSTSVPPDAQETQQPASPTPSPVATQTAEPESGSTPLAPATGTGAGSSNNTLWMFVSGLVLVVLTGLIGAAATLQRRHH